MSRKQLVVLSVLLLMSVINLLGSSVRAGTGVITLTTHKDAYQPGDILGFTVTGITPNWGLGFQHCLTVNGTSNPLVTMCYSLGSAGFGPISSDQNGVGYIGPAGVKLPGSENITFIVPDGLREGEELLLVRNANYEIEASTTIYIGNVSSSTSNTSSVTSVETQQTVTSTATSTVTQDISYASTYTAAIPELPASSITATLFLVLLATMLIVRRKH